MSEKIETTTCLTVGSVVDLSDQKKEFTFHGPQFDNPKQILEIKRLREILRILSTKEDFCLVDRINRVINTKAMEIVLHQCGSSILDFQSKSIGVNKFENLEPIFQAAIIAGEVELELNRYP